MDAISRFLEKVKYGDDEYKSQKQSAESPIQPKWFTSEDEREVMLRKLKEQEEMLELLKAKAASMK